MTALELIRLGCVFTRDPDGSIRSLHVPATVRDHARIKERVKAAVDWRVALFGAGLLRASEYRGRNICTGCGDKTIKDWCELCEVSSKRSQKEHTLSSEMESKQSKQEEQKKTPKQQLRLGIG